jgi:hypothetical protein
MAVVCSPMHTAGRDISKEREREREREVVMVVAILSKDVTNVHKLHIYRYNHNDPSFLTFFVTAAQHMVIIASIKART